MEENGIRRIKGIVYNLDRVKDISLCVCPPYDVISNIRAYHKKSEYNAVRLELPIQRRPLDKYNNAKRVLDEWLEERVLIEEKEETIYIYEQEFSLNGKNYLRRGFIALNRLDEKRILTHEETKPKAKEDRERLIKTLKMYTSHIFGLYEDKKGDIEGILKDSEKKVMFDFIDEDHIRNRFYKMVSSDEMDLLIQLMEDKKVYIADGHHRLSVSYKLNLPYIPIYLTNMYGTGLVILPYHRVIKLKRQLGISTILRRLGEHVDIRKRAFSDKGVLDLEQEILNYAERPVFIMYCKEDPSNFYILETKASVPVSEDEHEILKRLRVNILHKGILKNILDLADEEISFTQNLHGSVEHIKRGVFDMAFFLPPTRVEEVKEIADHKLFMPPKSTFFYPKIPTGLVFYRYE
ncbi:MAG: DUF1015 domain-containing protein [Syntrophorhabdaceae bacterium]|nr:DUF1015 domain-containing protein [Syntrophorhabdaceae bacterium]